MKILVVTIGQIARGDFEKTIIVNKAHNESIRKDIKNQLKDYDILPLFVSPEVSNIQFLEIEN